jgi:hypothetical protein
MMKLGVVLLNSEEGKHRCAWVYVLCGDEEAEVPTKTDSSDPHMIRHHREPQPNVVGASHQPYY